MKMIRKCLWMLIGVCALMSAGTAKADYDKFYESKTQLGVYNVKVHVVSKVLWGVAIYPYRGAMYWQPYADTSGPHGLYIRQFKWVTMRWPIIGGGIQPGPYPTYSGATAEPSHVNIWTEQWPGHWTVYQAFTPYSQGDVFVHFTPGGAVGYSQPPVSQNIYPPPQQTGYNGPGATGTGDPNQGGIGQPPADQMPPPPDDSLGGCLLMIWTFIVHLL